MQITFMMFSDLCFCCFFVVVVVVCVCVCVCVCAFFFFFFFFWPLHPRSFFSVYLHHFLFPETNTIVT